MAGDGGSRGSGQGLRLVRNDGVTTVIALPGFTKAQKARIRRIRDWERRSTGNVRGVVVRRQGDPVPDVQ